MTTIGRDDPVDRLGLSVREVAIALGINRNMVNDVQRTGASASSRWAGTG